MTHLLQRFRDSESGTAAIEFALIAGAFLTLLAGLFESGRFVMAMNSFQYSTESAARYAQTQTSMTEQQLEEAVIEYIEDEMNDLSMSGDKEISVNFYTTGGVDFIEIDGFYTFSPLIPILPDSWNGLVLRAKSKQPLPSD